mgnify:CR=1 FL=1
MPICSRCIYRNDRFKAWIFTGTGSRNRKDKRGSASGCPGGAVCAVAIVNGINPILAVLLAIIAGFVAGAITGLLHTKCQIPAILAGILTQIGLYSINLRIMGKSNTPLLQSDTIFKGLSNTFNLSQAWITLIIGIICAIIVILICYWFFGTEIGSAIRATGNNEHMVRALGANTNTTKLLGLMISNGLIAMSGALVTQSQGYADIKMGIGAIVIGLASIVIGEVILGRKPGFMFTLTAIIVGSILYRIIVAVVLQLGLTALLVGIALTVPVMVSKRKQIATYKKLTKEKENA